MLRISDLQPGRFFPPQADNSAATFLLPNGQFETAQSALVQVDDDTDIRFTLDGSEPTSSRGLLLKAGESILVEGRANLAGFRMIGVTEQTNLSVQLFL